LKSQAPPFIGKEVGQWLQEKWWEIQNQNIQNSCLACVTRQA